MTDRTIVELRRRIRVDACEDAPEGGQAILTVMTKDGRTMRKQTAHVRGSPANPMTRDEILTKASRLIEPLLGQATPALLDTMLHIGQLAATGEAIHAALSKMRPASGAIHAEP